MAKLYFYYGSVKSSLKTLNNYDERHILFIPKNNIHVELSSQVEVFDTNFNFYQFIKYENNITYILIDEAHFLTKTQVHQLTQIVDNLNISVMCYGLRSNYLGEPFEGSKYLLVLADKLIEITSICICGKNATMNMKKFNVCDEKSISLCRKCFYRFYT